MIVTSDPSCQVTAQRRFRKCADCPDWQGPPVRRRDRAGRAPAHDRRFRPGIGRTQRHRGARARMGRLAPRRGVVHEFLATTTVQTTAFDVT
jgi:hypothetical protein